ncbi:MAG TPA: chromosome segregation protein SMC [Elusimicrobiota bacterium]|nr:chromosome segregation protein SMC [Elusimicrobiota bacterium]
MAKDGQRSAMYLKSIEIVGFKSFADKTRIELRPGITGVIGPNGCGKSNIMEAIRWCIGEMSWKSLRSDSMVSVIFAGTARRAPMSLSEVTLTFDNAQSLLPVQYSEVSVTRRIFRSGESEYWMNKTQCRLRDIRELFLDTGIGSDGYAIIDQGGVDFVLKAKPEERRALFEEAAGVAKYKAKREEALRKLDKVEVDLARLQDSVSLINEQIKKLDSDARKAQLFQKYKGELAAMEAGQILQEAGQIETEIAAESQLVAPITERVAQLKTEMEADGARLAALNLERAQQDTLVIEANGRIAETKSETGRLEERIKNSIAMVETLGQQLAASEAELVLERARAAAMDPDIEKVRGEHAAAETRRDEARRERDEFHKGLAELEAALADARRSHEDARNGVLKAAQGCQDASREISHAQSKLGQFEFQVGQTLKELDKSAARGETARAEAAQASEEAGKQKTLLDSAAAELARLESEKARVSEALSQAADEKLRLHGEAAGVRAHIQALEAQGGKDPYWVGAHAVAQAGIPGVIGTVRSLIQVDDAHRHEVEDALGERLYAVVCESLEAATAGIEHLRAAGKGRARFLVASSIPDSYGRSAPYPGEARPLMDRVRFDAAHGKVLRYLLDEHYTLRGDLYADHWVYGGSSEGETLQLKLSDIGEARARLAALEAEQKAVSEHQASLQAESSSVEEALRGARDAQRDQSSRWHSLDAQRAQREKSVELYRQEAAGLDAEAARFLADIARAKEGLAGLAEALTRAQAAQAGAQEAEAAAAKAHEDLKGEAAGKRARESTLDESLGNLSSHADMLKSQLGRLIADKEALEASIARRQLTEADWRRRTEESRAEGAEAEKSLDERRRELSVLENEAAALFARQQEMFQAAEAMTKSLDERKKEHDQLTEKAHAADLKLSGLRSRAEFLRARLQQEWQLDWEQAKAQYSAQEVDAEKIQFLRRRIQALGNVNMAAPEEYEALTKKRDEMQGQIDDLANAKQDLRSVVTKINATTRENFRQTFEEVRGHFRKLYGILFEGGEADLILTEPEAPAEGEEPGEAGVDIVAQPPGKKLQAISQLSGGEKTLTAIALLFAFFMVRPSPMCMLDEADAALDEANVDRFVSLLKEFGSKSQFLIVSHNKKTMEACDVIYGITMEESGVSLLMSVDFKKKGAAQAAGDSAAATAA